MDLRASIARASVFGESKSFSLPRSVFVADSYWLRWLRELGVSSAFMIESLFIFEDFLRWFCSASCRVTKNVCELLFLFSRVIRESY